MIDLATVARELVAPEKGILAADESTGTITKRLAAVGVASSETTRRDYRDLLFGARGASAYLSGVILYDETLRQRARDGDPFPAKLTALGIHPGIKVDTGAQPLAGCPGETITEGLDGLRGRLEEYRGLGARFTKWRAVIAIGAGLPTDRALRANAEALARYAALAQECGLVPIVEPEVLMDGDHSIATCFSVTERTLHQVFSALVAHGVVLEEMLLKPNMVVAGKKCPEQPAPSVVAAETLRCLRRHVPAAVPGIVFLSGGQTPIEATRNLREMNREPHPWQLSFSYGRALQEEALRTWSGAEANVDRARAVFLRRAELTSKARRGEHEPAMESMLA
jgi:fructose-bisphosphate aldolase class I